MAKMISKGMTLGYKTDSASSSYTNLTNLYEIPDLGGTVETIEVTDLADAAHTYIKGLKSFGDTVSFKFWYDATQFSTLQGLTGDVYFQVGIPDGANGAIDTTCSFSGEPSVTLDGVGTNAALSYTLNITPKSDMIWA